MNATVLLSNFLTYLERHDDSIVCETFHCNYGIEISAYQHASQEANQYSSNKRFLVPPNASYCSYTSIMLLLFFSLVVGGNGFLLDAFQNKSGQAISNGQYLTVADFYDEKNIQHQDMEHLRQDMDKKLALLANQLQQQLGILSVDAIRNETKRDMMLLAQEYTTLEQDYNKLQTSHNQLKEEHTMLQGRMNIQSMLNNYTDTKIRKNEKEIEMLINKSIAVENELSVLKRLGNIKPLQDISALQQHVQTLQSQTHTLNMKEQSRIQDFLALFNMTMESKKEANVQFHNQTVALSALKNRMNDRFKTSEKHENLTFSLIQDQLNNNAEKVAITAFYQNTETVSSGSVLKFDDVNFSVGITNLSSFKGTGKFFCEQSGLYMISVSILSETNGANFYIYRNGDQISTTHIAQPGKNLWHTGTVTIAWQLEFRDNLWVQTDGIVIHGGSYSKFTIIKVK